MIFIVVSEIVRSVALLHLPGLLREKLELFICSEQHYETNAEETTGNPVIVFQGANPFESANFDVYADGIKILTVDSIAKAFEMLITCFFVLNIAYPKDMVKTLTFLQKVIVNLQDKIKNPKAIVTLLSNINRQ